MAKGAKKARQKTVRTLTAKDILEKIRLTSSDKRLREALDYSNMVALRNGKELEKIGGRWMVRPPQQAEKTLSGLKQMAGDRLFEVKNVSVCGIYFLCKEDSIVYVGQSISIYSRVYEHKKSGIKDFDSVFAIPCEKEKLSKVESAFIYLLKPKYNWSRTLGEFCAPFRKAAGDFEKILNDEIEINPTKELLKR